MEIYQLRYFVYAAKYENITMAAQELNVSQPSISKAIQSLERELKTELLRKNGRSCVLTRDGYLLQERVVPLLEEIERLPLEFHNRQKKKPVSYTHLDVYKRQVLDGPIIVISLSGFSGSARMCV